MKCFRCQTPIRTRPNVKYCDICRPIVKAEQTSIHSVRISEIRKERAGSRAAIQKYAPTQYKSPISDAEQKELNCAVDDKSSVSLSLRILKPGDPGFAAVAAQVTPLRRIRGREEILIYQTEATDYRHTRNESSDSL